MIGKPLILGFWIASFSSAISAAEPDQSSEWRFVEDTDRCAASFVTDREGAFLAIRQDSRLVIRAHSKDWRLPLNRKVLARARLAEGELILDAVTAETSDKWSGFTALAPESALDTLASEAPLAVTLAPEFEATIGLVGLSRVAPRLKACAEKMNRLSPELYPVRSPILVGGLNFSPGHFSGISYAGAQFRFRLTVGRDGKPTACEVVETSGQAALDARACGLLMSMAKFKPAVNAKGEAVEDSFQSSIRF